MANPFKQPTLANTYDVMLNLAKDKTSELYHKDGRQRGGGLHRCAFWAGFNDQKVLWVPKGSIAWACLRAGQQHRKQTKKVVE